MRKAIPQSVWHDSLACLQAGDGRRRVARHLGPALLPQHDEIDGLQQHRRKAAVAGMSAR